MNFALIRNSLLDKIREEVFSYEDIVTFGSDLVTTLGIDGYLKEIKFLPSQWEEDLVIYSLKNRSFTKDEKYKNDPFVIENPVNILSTYSFFDRTIKIDIDNIISEAIEYFDNDESEQILFINMCILECMIHEVVHTYQNFAIHETDYSLYQLMTLELSRFEIMDDKEYNKFYNTFIFEREAIITTYETLMIIAKHFLHNDALFEYYKDNLTKVLLGGYKVKKTRKVDSPLEIKYKYLFKKKTPEVMSLDVYEALKYGFPVSYQEFVDFKKNNNELILRKTACNR